VAGSPLRFAALVSGMLLGGLPAAGAQMVQCNGVSGGVSYKVLVDDVRHATATSTEAALSVDLIRSSVEGALDKVRQTVLKGASSQQSVKYLTCPGRHPGSPTAFDDVNLVRSMAANHAILELWGTLFPLGGNQYQFDIHYVMFPLASLAGPAPAGVASTQQKMSGYPTPAQVQGLLTATRADLPIYFAVAAGVKAYTDRQFDQSVRFLCEARSRIKDKAKLEELRNFSDTLASRAVVELRKRPNSVHSMLPDPPPGKSYCEVVTTR
jgi:hypothetical protein